jgi:hypothetical protein
MLPLREVVAAAVGNLAKNDAPVAAAAEVAAYTMASKLPIGVDIPTPTAALVTALATVVTSTMASSSPTATGSPTDGEDTGECRLLGSFALIVQAALGGLAMLSLVYKRWRERPQRPVKIWFFDVSKQVFGSVLVHIANVFMSMLTSGRLSIKVPTPVVQTMRLMLRDADPYAPNPCSFYLLNLAIDVSRDTQPHYPDRRLELTMPNFRPPLESQSLSCSSKLPPG